MGLTRRELGAAAVAAASGVARAESGPLTFVLVSGAWHGGWCWRRVERSLRAKGHQVFAPSLTGVADRAHLLTKDVALSTHVEDVARLLELEDLREVVLVGHSYGGMVITGVAAKAAARLARLLYLDAFVPAPGQSAFDLMSPKYVESWRRRAREQGDGYRVPPMLSARAMGVVDAKDAAWVDAKLTPHPLRTFEEKLSFDPKALAGLAKTYVWCTAYSGFGPTAARVKGQGFTVHELDAGHDAMVTAPDALAAALAQG